MGSGSAALGAVLVAAGGLLLFAVAAFGSAVQQVFLLCLYRYATDGDVRGFSEQDLANPPFRQRRGLFG
jgi:hypothetical protein